MQMTRSKGDEVLDEGDWPADCKAQQEMEKHLRCQICSDYFHGPVMLPCSHTFCSTCVHRILESKGAHGCCPQCKQPCASQDLVPNRVLEHVALLFQKSKPDLLKRLQGIAALRSATSTPNTESGKVKKTKQVKAERMPLLSYSVMSDEEVRKLLGFINVQVPTKNREEIIQIHKEFVLLSNAQANFDNPASTAQLREEVMRNHHARMQQKAKINAAKRNQSENEDSGSGNAASPKPSPVLVQIRANFDKLQQDIADRKAGKLPPTQLKNTSSTSTLQKKMNGASIGVWRHFCAQDTGIQQEFYVNSLTHEIRAELPSSLVQKWSPANRYDDLGGVARAVAKRVLAGSGDAAIALTPPRSKGKVKQAIPAAFALLNATSALQGAAEEIVISINEGDDGEEKHEQTGENEKRKSLGKHARSGDGDDSAADDSTEDADEAASKWQCSRCTFINEATCQQCEACGFELASIVTEKRLRKKMRLEGNIALS